MFTMNIILLVLLALHFLNVLITQFVCMKVNAFLKKRGSLTKLFLQNFNLGLGPQKLTFHYVVNRLWGGFVINEILSSEMPSCP